MKDGILRVYSVIASVMLVVLIISCAIQVIGRYFLPSSPPWTEELARVAFLWFSCLGASIALDKGAHASITVILDKVPGAAGKGLRMILLAGILAMSILLTHTGYLLGMATKSTPSPSMRMPMIIMNISVMFCGIGMLLSSLCSILNIFKSEQPEKEVNKK